VADLLAQLQIQTSLLRITYHEDDPFDPLAIVWSAEDRIVDAAEIYARTSVLFQYARGQTGQPPEPDEWRRRWKGGLVAFGFYDLDGADAALYDRFRKHSGESD
jgi:hypothetical protein